MILQRSSSTSTDTSGTTARCPQHGALPAVLPALSGASVKPCQHTTSRNTLHSLTDLHALQCNKTSPLQSELPHQLKPTPPRRAPVSLPMKRFRLGPTSSGMRPHTPRSVSRRITAKCPSSSALPSEVLANPRPGSSTRFQGSTPASTARAARCCSAWPTSRHTQLYVVCCGCKM